MKPNIYYFGAGPAMLPESILKTIQQELFDWNGTGLSMLELGHRTESFKTLLLNTEHKLRALLSLPENYQILFSAGPTRTQFAQIPMNFLDDQSMGAYLLSGLWSEMALKEAVHLKQAYCLASSKQNDSYYSVPEAHAWQVKKDTAYVYYTPNETVNGTRFPYIPDVGSTPLIADMTSCLLSEPLDCSRYDLIFAGVQKNIAHAGLTIVIIREEFLKNKANTTAIPSMLDYQLQVQHHSLYATLPTFNCYVAGLMFDWIKEQGGVAHLFEQNCLKAKTLYEYLDSSDFYQTLVTSDARSLVNVCFFIKDPALEALFLVKAQEQGFYGLQGHRLVGGLRASLYNAMPLVGVQKLIEFMADFAKKHQA